ncbi:MAG TPA: hypothetical protein VFR20_09575 [Burkholderiaceae bacterium]|nr:hypothetical protein [Burkholderiaceae bacterium]
MKIKHDIVALVLAGVAGMATGTNAAAQCTTTPFPGPPKEVLIRCTLAQTAQPIAPPTYPGVDFNIFGFRTGMTVAQVEALAAKIHLGKPGIKTKPLDNEVKMWGATALAQGAPINQISYDFRLAGGSNRATVIIYFSSPATGSVSEAVYENSNYITDRRQKRPLVAPVVTKLVHQYGPSSSRTPSYMSQYLCWNFKGQSLVKASLRQPCYPNADDVMGTNVAAMGNGTYHPADSYIYALLSTNSGEVNGLAQGLGDYRLAALDRSEIKKQLTLAIEKYSPPTQTSASTHR